MVVKKRVCKTTKKTAVKSRKSKGKWNPKLNKDSDGNIKLFGNPIERDKSGNIKLSSRQRRDKAKRNVEREKNIWGSWGFSGKGLGRTSLKGISHKMKKETIGKVQSIGRTSNARRKYV